MNSFMGGGAKKEAESSCSHWAFVLGGTVSWPGPFLGSLSASCLLKGGQLSSIVMSCASAWGQ